MGNLLNIGRMDVPTYSFGPHAHNTWEIAYYYFGSGINTVGGTEYAFSPGTIICQPPFVEHEEKSERGYKNYFFSLKNMGAVSEPPVALIFCDTPNNDFFNILKPLYYECRIRGHEMVAEALTDAVTAYITELSRNLVKKNPYVERFEHTLAANISNPDFNITAEVKKLPFSVNHFRNMFISQTGLPPKRYLRRIRIEQAKSLLCGNSLSVGDVGRICGFVDPYYFSRAFKSETGLPPSLYRARTAST